VTLLYKAKKVPTDRALSYPVFRNLVSSISDLAVDFDQKGREELQMMEYFLFDAPSETQTPEER
jgi:hypothetical protein